MVAYATTDEVRPLIGNLGSQISETDIQKAIDSATAQVNRKTNRLPPNDWKDTDVDFNVIKKITRYIAALERSVGLKDFEDRKVMQEEIDRMFMTILEYGTDPASVTDFVESSEPISWPANKAGEIWSVRYPRLRKQTSSENYQYEINFDIGGGP